MLKNIILIAIALLVGISYYGNYLKMKQGAGSQTMTAQVLPDFSWQDYEGKSHNIKDLKGKTILLHFWATWCRPCRKEFPELLASARKLGDGVVIVTISSDDDTQTAASFVASMQQQAGVKPENVLYAIDANRAITSDLFQTMAFPETILVDKNAQMRRKWVGSMNWKNEETLTLIKGM